jgi:hypothetical protein
VLFINFKRIEELVCPRGAKWQVRSVKEKEKNEEKEKEKGESGTGTGTGSGSGSGWFSLSKQLKSLRCVALLDFQ